MPQSLSNVLLHVVFSTKDREPLLLPELQVDLHSYIGGIADNLGSRLLAAGSVADHVRLLAVESRTCTQADFIRNIKTGSTKWLKSKGRHFQDFHWQNGYGIFSISPSHRKALERYLGNQAAHHESVSFQDEFRRILRKNEIEYDERYVWD